MNGAHLHLVINHVPLFGIGFGLVALVWSMIKKSQDMRWAAIAFFILSAITGWIAAESGEAAEEIIENIPGIIKAQIHEHEEAADFAKISTTLLATLAILWGVLDWLKSKYFKWTQAVLLILALFSLTVVLRTAFLGGQIRHSEIRPNADS